jgi:monoamine oxidase
MAGRNPKQFDRRAQMTTGESFSELGFRFLHLAKQLENSGVLIGILEGQIKQQQQAISEAQAIIKTLRGLVAAEAVSVPIKVLNQSGAPGD